MKTWKCISFSSIWTTSQAGLDGIKERRARNSNKKHFVSCICVTRPKVVVIHRFFAVIVVVVVVVLKLYHTHTHTYTHRQIQLKKNVRVQSTIIPRIRRVSKSNNVCIVFRLERRDDYDDNIQFYFFARLCVVYIVCFHSNKFFSVFPLKQIFWIQLTRGCSQVRS